VTVFTRGDVTFDDPIAGNGTIGYGGLEWARAGLGMWHGKELSAGSSPMVQGFQLWIALPPKLERAEPEAQYIGADSVPSVGSARRIVGMYDSAASPVRAPRGINYLLVTLTPGESWMYEPPGGHTLAWVAVADGAPTGSERLSSGELVIFEPDEVPITFEGAEGVGATFVLGLQCRIRTSGI
jgi:redox-sensitive bicupin YhaK (pirin superfamily)